LVVAHSSITWSLKQIFRYIFTTVLGCNNTDTTGHNCSSIYTTTGHVGYNNVYHSIGIVAAMSMQLGMVVPISIRQAALLKTNKIYKR
jgi:hypothetical protein